MTYESPGNHDLAEALRAYRPGWDGAESVDVAGDWQKLKAAMGQGAGAGKAPTLGTGTRRLGAQPLLLRAATVVVGLAMVLIGVVFAHQRLAESPKPFAQYATRAGQHLRISLPDGSALTLAPQTILQIGRGFGTSNRSVWLTGEAYFEVRASSGTAFMIHTGTITTRVLGTTFDVRRYRNDREVRVAVSSGRVIVNAAAGRRPTLTLSAGMVGQVSDSSAERSTMDAATEVTDWAAGWLIFREVPTSSILATVSRWYGYQFRLGDSSMAKKKLTVWLSTESSAAALSTLKLALDADMTFEGSVVTLRPHQAAADDRLSRPHRMDFHSPRISEVGR